jgi:hypothetical protein
VYYRVTFEDGAEWVYDGPVTSVQCEPDDFFQCTPLTARSFLGFIIGAGGAGNVLFGVDLPFHRYSENHNFDSSNALSMIEYPIMNTNSLYMREAGIQHQLGLVWFGLVWFGCNQSLTNSRSLCATARTSHNRMPAMVSYPRAATFSILLVVSIQTRFKWEWQSTLFDLSSATLQNLSFKL